MGTNYYVRYKICNVCNRYEELHLGKKSVGWKFSFQAIDLVDKDIEIKSYKQWLKFIVDNEAVIYNEDGENILLKEFQDIVKNSLKEKNDIVMYCKKEHEQDECYYDEEGYCMQLREFC